jgi:hypothetical protein
VFPYLGPLSLHLELHTIKHVVLLRNNVELHINKHELWLFIVYYLHLHLELLPNQQVPHLFNVGFGLIEFVTTYLHSFVMAFKSLRYNSWNMFTSFMCVHHFDYFNFWRILLVSMQHWTLVNYACYCSFHVIKGVLYLVSYFLVLGITGFTRWTLLGMLATFLLHTFSYILVGTYSFLSTTWSNCLCKLVVTILDMLTQNFQN